jgi:ABC-type Fe3+/spermidine/putrescine transport system ATPase subunit
MAISDRIVVMSNGRIKQMGKPSEIYDSPRDPFTAEFIGLANLLPGKLAGERTVVLGNQQRLELDGAVAVGAGAEVLVSIRPHHIKIKTNSAGSGASNQLTGVVEKAAYLGDRVDYRVLIGERVLRVQTEPGEFHAEGTKVALLLPPDKISVIPARVQ